MRRTDPGPAELQSLVEVNADGNQQLADLYQRRFRPEFLPVPEAWIASDPVNNPSAESSPLREPQYKVANLARATELDKQGDEHFEEGKDATEHTDSYVFTTVFFATVLFFAGISMRFVWQRMRIAVLVLGTIFLGTRPCRSPACPSCSAGSLPT